MTLSALKDELEDEASIIVGKAFAVEITATEITARIPLSNGALLALGGAQNVEGMQIEG